MKMHLIDWNSSGHIGAMLAAEAKQGDKRDLQQAKDFCQKLNAILDEGGNGRLIDQRHLYDAVSALPMPAGFRHIRVVNAEDGMEVGQSFTTEGWEPSSDLWHTAVGSPQHFAVERVSNVRPGPLLEAGMLTLVADLEGEKRYDYNPLPIYLVEP